jgi:hypothetical protein
MSHHLHPSASGHDSSILRQVYQGMDVYNNANEQIGTVEAVYLGAANDAESGAEPATDNAHALPGTRVQRFVAELFDPTDMPDEVAERLRQSGYFRIDGPGLLAGDRFVMPDQIAHVSEKGVYLRTAEAAQIKNE